MRHGCHDRDMTTTLLDDLRSSFEQDGRIEAAWLEGSHASGTADDWSDLDLHVAVGGDAFDELSGDAGIRSLVEPVAPILGGHRMPFGPDLVLLNVTVGGPARLDLYVERAPEGAARALQAPLRVLFDRTGITDRYVVDRAHALP